MKHCNVCNYKIRIHRCLICLKRFCGSCVVNYICKDCLALYIEQQINKQEADTNEKKVLCE